MNKENLLEELERSYEVLRKDQKIKVKLEDLDKIFFVKDAILKDGFVSTKVSRQICYRISEALMSWNEYLHSLLMPNPQNMLNMSESKILSQDEKRVIRDFMKKIMALTSRNSIIGITRDPKEETKFMEDAVYFWENDFKEDILKIVRKINLEWENKNENA